MERKLIKLSRNSLVVTLPQEWVIETGLKKGDVVTIATTPKEAIISPQKKKHTKIDSLDLRYLPSRFIKRAIAAAYKIGFEKITLLYNSSQEQAIQQELEKYSGIIILEHRKETMLIENAISVQDFLPLFNKTFFLINASFTNVLDQTKESTVTFQDHARERERIKKHIALCIQVLNTKGQGTLRESNTYLHLLSTLDHVSELIVRLAKHLTHERPSKNNATLFMTVQTFLNAAQAYYFSKGSLSQAYACREAVLIRKHHEPTDIVGTYLVLIGQCIRELIEHKYAIEIIRKDHTR